LIKPAASWQFYFTANHNRSYHTCYTVSNRVKSRPPHCSAFHGRRRLYAREAWTKDISLRQSDRTMQATRSQANTSPVAKPLLAGWLLMNSA